jgi:hypothetical protein
MEVEFTGPIFELYDLIKYYLQIENSGIEIIIIYSPIASGADNDGDESMCY